MSQAHETEDEIVINNLMESQLQMHDDENEDFKIIENLLFATHERTYNKLDRKTSRKVVAAITSSEPQAGKNPKQSLRNLKPTYKLIFQR